MWICCTPLWPKVKVGPQWGFEPWPSGPQTLQAFHLRPEVVWHLCPPLEAGSVGLGMRVLTRAQNLVHARLLRILC